MDFLVQLFKDVKTNYNKYKCVRKREAEIKNLYLTVINSVPVSTKILDVTDIMTEKRGIKHVHMDNNSI